MSSASPPEEIFSRIYPLIPHNILRVERNPCADPSRISDILLRFRNGGWIADAVVLLANIAKNHAHFYAHIIPIYRGHLLF
jgi:hypothetical protein